MINADDAFAPYFAERAHGRRLLRYGLDASADVGARDIVVGETESRFTIVSPVGDATVVLPLAGRHNVTNALAAASIALALGVPLATIAEGLSGMQPVAGRLVRHRLGNGATLIDDSYNANPGSSTPPSTRLLPPAAKLAGVGDMRELGGDAPRCTPRQAAGEGRRHRRLFALGPLSGDRRGVRRRGEHFGTHEALVEALRRNCTARRVLVKGSRGSAMDRIVSALLGREGEISHAA